MSSDIRSEVLRPSSGHRPTHATPQTPFQRLFRPVDVSFLACFRVSFGAVMLWHVWRYFATGEIAALYIDPPFHFTYYGFEWVRPWPGAGMYLHFFAMGLLALGILVGLHYRVCAALFWLAFTYQFLLDKSLYQNHYYLISLISFLLIFLPAHRAASLDAWLRPALRSETAPAWTLWILRAQIGIPYFYGGIAKLNPDWLRCEPMRQGMAEPHRTGIPLIGQFFTEEWMVMLFSYGGLLLDLCIVPLLLWRRTRFAAFVLALAFHCLNSIMFNIGIFPWFMILATLVFFEPDWPRRLARRVFDWLPARFASDGPPPVIAHSNAPPSPLGQRAIAVLLAAWLAVQLLVPLRHYLYPGDASWTEEGHLFAWHMMLRGKRCAVSYLATYPATGQTAPVRIQRYLTERQVLKLGKDPDMLREFAQFVAAEAQRAGFADVQVHAISLVSLNGRRPQLLIDPTVNLAAQRRSFRPTPWIMPLVEPLPKTSFDEPPESWGKYAQSSWEELKDRSSFSLANNPP